MFIPQAGKVGQEQLYSQGVMKIHLRQLSEEMQQTVYTRCSVDIAVENREVLFARIYLKSTRYWVYFLPAQERRIFLMKDRIYEGMLISILKDEKRGVLCPHPLLCPLFPDLLPLFIPLLLLNVNAP